MLYIVGTPIGNLDDLSYRQAKTLCDSEIILTEDTRSTGLLFERIKQMFSFERNPNQRLISYYKEKEFEKLPEILELLQSDKIISLITQAGMPLISDPGFLLMKNVIKNQLPYTVVPGPTAYTTALVHSGFPNDPSMYIGFLPKRENEKKKVFNLIQKTKEIVKDLSVIFYESPQRINETLALLEPYGWNICVTRELTKKFEEVARGKAEELKTKTYKGEITVVIQ